jgi:hypothetical protein
VGIVGWQVGGRGTFPRFGNPIFHIGAAIIGTPGQQKQYPVDKLCKRFIYLLAHAKEATPMSAPLEALYDLRLRNAEAFNSQHFREGDYRMLLPLNLVPDSSSTAD